jgi:DNA-binding MarR family transcriptional regulator
MTRTVDAETQLLDAPDEHRDELRLWLRLLTCTNLAEATVRRRLREGFNVTLPRFDLLAQLERSPGGLTLGEISKRMMVSNGNITLLVDRLAADGHLERSSAPNDRRVQIITLTEKGRSSFGHMAKSHAEWMAELFGGLTKAEVATLLTLLQKVKVGLNAVDIKASRGARGGPP